MEKTNRGFEYSEFTDYYGVNCSLQKSSSGTQSCIWFGVNEPNPRVCVQGMGWQPIDLPKGTLCDTRMHLTQEQVKELLPYLQKFVETGELS